MTQFSSTNKHPAITVPPPVVNVVKPDGSPVPVQKTDNKDGTYKVDFTPQDTGVVLSHVSVAGQPVPGSPFKTTVQPQTTTPAKVSDVPKGMGFSILITIT